MSDAQGPLAIVAGGGSIPIAVAEAVMRRGRRVVLFPVSGWADPAAVERFPHHWINVGQGGRLTRLAHSEGCRDLVLVGTAVRPALASVRLDWTTFRLLPAVWRAYRGGDDHLLSGLAQLFQGLGFRLVGAHEVAPEILVPRGNIGTLGRDRATSPISHAGSRCCAAIGPFDVGQAVVVADNQVLAVEAVDGTDNMLERIAELRERGRVATGKASAC
jgi:DUF1009 family protein